VLLLASFALPWGLGGCASGHGGNRSDAGAPPPLASEVEPATLSLGGFDIALVGEEADEVALRITRTDAPDRVLWSTPPGVAFVTAARGDEQVDSLRGSFTFEDVILARCDRQTITRFARSGDDVAVWGHVSGEDCYADYTLALSAPAQDRLSFELTLEGAGDGVNRTTLTAAANQDERFYGFGTQYSYLDMSGRKVPVWVREQGIGRGLEPLTTLLDTASPGSAGDWYTTYAPLPYYLTSAGRAAILEDTEYSVFDLTEPGQVAATVWRSGITGDILAGETPRQQVQALTEVVGRMQPLPPWTQTGAIVRVHGGSSAVLDAVDTYEEAGVPLAGVWIEDWVGERSTAGGSRLWWNWEPDADLYPDWEVLIRTLRDRDIRVLTYFNPFLVDASDKDNAKYNLYQEALDAGFLVRKQDGSPYLIDQAGFQAAMVDLTRPEARAWLKQILERQLRAGVSGWMADFGEALPYDARLYNGSPEAFHNQYPLEWARLNREALEEEDALGDAVFFSRSGYTGSAGESTLFWLGDQTVSWDEFDGIKTVVKGLLSSGLSGFALEHGDIGGYFSISLGAATYRRSRELLWRWIELAAFTAMFRTHETNDRDVNFQVDSDAETLEQFARFARIFAALAPYRQTLMQKAADRGYPLVRHLLFENPDDPEAYNIDDEFMLGPDVLVAPVLDAAVTSRRVYLPAGQWVHLWSKQAMGSASEGSWVEVDAPLGEPPVFYRPGSAAGAALAEAI
jgi:alpha-glucosidase